EAGEEAGEREAPRRAGRVRRLAEAAPRGEGGACGHDERRGGVGAPGRHGEAAPGERAAAAVRAGQAHLVVGVVEAAGGGAEVRGEHAGLVVDLGLQLGAEEAEAVARLATLAVTEERAVALGVEVEHGRVAAGARAAVDAQRVGAVAALDGGGGERLGHGRPCGRATKKGRLSRTGKTAYAR